MTTLPALLHQFWHGPVVHFAALQAWFATIFWNPELYVVFLYHQYVSKLQECLTLARLTSK